MNVGGAWLPFLHWAVFPQIEAVMDRIKDNISLDHLARLLVDVHVDSSTIVDSTLSAYQRRLLHFVFNGDAESRDKVCISFAGYVAYRVRCVSSALVSLCRR